MMCPILKRTEILDFNIYVVTFPFYDQQKEGKK